jgi:hypothetical protein
MSREAFSQGWDGRIKGQLQPTSTYVWIMEYTNATGETRVYKGTSLLLRQDIKTAGPGGSRIKACI